MIHIDEIVLRVPHMGVEEGRVLGKMIAQGIRDRMPSTDRHKKLDQLDIQLKFREGLSRDELSREIVEQIMLQLKIASQ